MRPLALSLALSLALGLVPALARADTWTVMVYVAADNDIEYDSIDIATAMVSVSDARLSVVVQADRFGAHDDTVFPGADAYQGTRRFVIADGAFSLLDDLGAIDATDPQTLTDFESWAMNAYPADHYALVLWDHGGAWQGAMSDEHHGRQLMPALDLANAIGDGLPTGVTLDLLGFDTCLLANVDVLQGVASFARIIVASEEEQYGSWDYAAFFHAIVDAPAATPLSVARAIVDSQPAQEEANGDPAYTLAAIDGARFTSLVTPHLASFGTALEAAMADPRLAREIVRARGAADGFGRAPTEDIFEVIDLGQFARRLASTQAIAGTSLATEAVGVLDAIDQTVVHHVAGAAHAGAFGLSIYLPAADADTNYTAEQVPFPEGATWPAFVSAYAQRAANAGAPQISDAAFVSGTLVAHTVGDDIDRVHVVLARQDASGLTFLGGLPSVQGGGAADAFEGGAVRFAWPLEWPRVTDGTSEAAAAIVATTTFDSNGDHAIVAMPAEIDRGDGFARAAILFDLDLNTMRGRAIAGYRFAAGAGASMVRLAGVRVRALSVQLASDGSLVIGAGTTELAGDSLSLVPRPVPDGRYQFGVVVTDLAHHVASRLVPVEIANGALRETTATTTPSSSDAAMLESLALVSAGLLVAFLGGFWLVRRRRSR